MRPWRETGRSHARDILTAMLIAVNPQTVFRNHVAHSEGVLRVDGTPVANLAKARRLHIAAVGKAAGGMAAQAQAWGPFASALLVTPVPVEVDGFDTVVGGHPQPDEASLEAGARLLAMARDMGEDDTLLLLLSGGASALADVPAVSLEDLRRTTELLLASGADIAQVNTVRKHLSDLKGGGLARAARGRIVVLAISDVAGDAPADIGSGPAAADPTTYQDALDVLAKHDLVDIVPTAVRTVLTEGVQGRREESLKPDDARAARASHHVLATNSDALLAGARAAAGLGYEVHVFHESLAGVARDMGRHLAATARELVGGPAKPRALLFGGETVVRLTGNGRGGRNMETALAAVDGLSALDAVLACVGTDGRDGPTDAAGAIVDGLTRARAESLGLDVQAYLAENDSYHYFAALDDLVKTGPTGTNVRDVAVLLLGPTDRDA